MLTISYYKHSSFNPLLSRRCTFVISSVLAQVHFWIFPSHIARYKNSKCVLSRRQIDFIYHILNIRGRVMFIVYPGKSLRPSRNRLRRRRISWIGHRGMLQAILWCLQQPSPDGSMIRLILAGIPWHPFYLWSEPQIHQFSREAFVALTLLTEMRTTINDILPQQALCNLRLKASVVNATH
jgi:hypothetical protein